MKAFTVTVKLPDANQMLRKRNLETGGLVQQAIDNAVMQYAIPYCPFDTGTLAYSPYINYVPGEIVYPGPCARYLYYGEVYGPNIPVYEDDSGVPTRYFSPPGRKKHPTGRELQFKTDQNPLAGPFWIDRMKADRMKDITEVAKRAAGIK